MSDASLSMRVVERSAVYFQDADEAGPMPEPTPKPSGEPIETKVETKSKPVESEPRRQLDRPDKPVDSFAHKHNHVRERPVATPPRETTPREATPRETTTPIAEREPSAELRSSPAVEAKITSIEEGNRTVVNKTDTKPPSDINPSENSSPKLAFNNDMRTRDGVLDLFSLGSRVRPYNDSAADVRDLNALDPAAHAGRSEEALLTAASFKNAERASAVLPSAAHDANFSPPLMSSKYSMIHDAVVKLSMLTASSGEVAEKPIIKFYPGGEVLFTDTKLASLFDVAPWRRIKFVDAARQADAAGRADAGQQPNQTAAGVKGLSAAAAMIASLKASVLGMFAIFQGRGDAESQSVLRDIFISPWAIPGEVFAAMRNKGTIWDVKNDKWRTPSFVDRLMDAFSGKQSFNESLGIILYIFFFLLMVLLIPLLF